MTSKPRHSHPTAFKLKVVEFAEQHNKVKAAQAFNVNRRRVGEWCQSKDKLIACPKDRLRVVGGGKKPLMADVEVKLEVWIRECRAEGQKVTTKVVMAKAEKMAKEQGIAFKGTM